MSNDKKLQEAVLAELNWAPDIASAHVGVTAKDGVVTLTGHVENYSQKRSAEEAAGRVKGVKAIAEELEVRLPFTIKRDDAQIAAAAVDRLDWDVSVPEDKVKVKVEGGWVTLTGEVDWHYQKEAAHDDIRPLNSVIGISNQITIKSRVNTSDISNKIQEALHRNWFFQPKLIDVTANGGKVKLSGSVNNWHDRDVAGSTAWAAAGTTEVENNILVN